MIAVVHLEPGLGWMVSPLLLLLFGKYLEVGSTPGAILLRNTGPRKRSDIRSDTLKNAKRVEELKVGDSERRKGRRPREYRSRQHSRRYITAEDKAMLKIRLKA